MNVTSSAFVPLRRLRRRRLPLRLQRSHAAGRARRERDMRMRSPLRLRRRRARLPVRHPAVLIVARRCPTLAVPGRSGDLAPP